MIRVAITGLLLALAGCPQHGNTAQAPSAAGCPSAAGVYIASYVQQDPGKGRSGWAVPLLAKPLEGDVPLYASVDAATASLAGVPAPPKGTLWLATAGAAPCRAKVGGYYAARVEGSQSSVSYGFELDGCPPPKNPEESGGIVLVSDAAPMGCHFEVPQPVAGRLGETNAQKQWQRPTKESPLPAPLASALPQKACDPPACEKLWAFAEVKVEGKPIAWTGAINWLQIGAEADQCSWQSERESGFWLATPTGASKVMEGLEHPLPLVAVLADGGGAKVALAEANGEYATYDLTPGKATLGHRVVWMLSPPQAWQQIDRLGPVCDEDRD